MTNTFENDAILENSDQDKVTTDTDHPDRTPSSLEDGYHPGSLDWLAAHMHVPHNLSSSAPRPIPAWEAIGKADGWLNQVRKACAVAPSEAGKAAEWLLDND